MTEELRCRLCGEPLRVGLVASGRRACCLNATPIAGTCPTHGPVGPHHVTEPTTDPDSAPAETDPTETDRGGDQ